MELTDVAVINRQLLLIPSHLQSKDQDHRMCQADVTFSSDNFSHREQTEPMPQQYSDLRV